MRTRPKLENINDIVLDIPLSQAQSGDILGITNFAGHNPIDRVKLFVIFYRL